MEHEAKREALESLGFKVGTKAINVPENFKQNWDCSLRLDFGRRSEYVTVYTYDHPGDHNGDKVTDVILKANWVAPINRNGPIHISPAENAYMITDYDGKNYIFDETYKLYSWLLEKFEQKWYAHAYFTWEEFIEFGIKSEQSVEKTQAIIDSINLDYIKLETES